MSIEINELSVKKIYQGDTLINRIYIGDVEIYPGGSLFLNKNPCWVSLSFRNLNNQYSGRALRVRRASDNIESDINYLPDKTFDTASIESFCAGTNGFMVLWEDTSGVGLAVSNSVFLEQPQIVTNGVFSNKVTFAGGQPKLKTSAPFNTGGVVTGVEATERGILSFEVRVDNQTLDFGPLSDPRLIEYFIFKSVLDNQTLADFLVDVETNTVAPNISNYGTFTNFFRTWRQRKEIVTFPFIDTSGALSLDETWTFCTGLTSFPLINTSQVTFFKNTWYACSSLSTFPLIDTSNALSLEGVWFGCSGLTSFPEINTSQVTSLSTTWSFNSLLTSFPLLDTSACTNFSQTWRDCTGLLSFSLIDTSSATNLNLTWYNCNKLTSFPLLNTSQVTNFYGAWWNCVGLTSFPLIDTSLGTNFDGAWWNCVGLTSFPLINTSNGLLFSNAWRECLGLTSFPLINTSLGTSFNSAWLQCSSLTSFPLLNVSNGTNFFNSWYGCSSLTSFPSLSLSNGMNFLRAWYICTSLVTFPANMFDTCQATNYTEAWVGCALNQTSVDNILVSIDTARATYSLVNGEIGLNGGTNSTPSATGLAAKANLQSAGWVVNTN